jgi:hypothetical protein
MVGRGECSLHHAHRGTLYDVVPWCNCFKNWNGQLVVSGPSPLSRGAGIGNSLLLQCPYSVPWSPSGQVSHGSMACVARELGGSESGLGLETPLEGCGFCKQFAVLMSILGAMVAVVSAVSWFQSALSSSLARVS